MLRTILLYGRSTKTPQVGLQRGEKAYHGRSRIPNKYRPGIENEITSGAIHFAFDENQFVEFENGNGTKETKLAVGFGFWPENSTSVASATA